jgi:hypothetical protein
MQNSKQPAPQAMKPSPNPVAIPNEPDRMAREHEQGEGSYSGTADYQKGVKAYLERADVEQDARDAAPADAREARELEDAEKAGRAGDTTAKKSRKTGK